jgi:hypothetical protein
MSNIFRETNRTEGGDTKIDQQVGKEDTMEELQKSLIAEIGKQLKSEKMNVQLLDVLNRLLGTVGNYLLADK